MSRRRSAVAHANAGRLFQQCEKTMVLKDVDVALRGMRSSTIHRGFERAGETRLSPPRTGAARCDDLVRRSFLENVESLGQRSAFPPCSGLAFDETRKSMTPALQ